MSFGPLALGIPSNQATWFALRLHRTCLNPQMRQSSDLGQRFGACSIPDASSDLPSHQVWNAPCMALFWFKDHSLRRALGRSVSRHASDRGIRGLVGFTLVVFQRVPRDSKCSEVGNILYLKL